MLWPAMAKEGWVEFVGGGKPEWWGAKVFEKGADFVQGLGVRAVVECYFPD